MSLRRRYRAHDTYRLSGAGLDRRREPCAGGPYALRDGPQPQWGAAPIPPARRIVRMVLQGIRTSPERNRPQMTTTSRSNFAAGLRTTLLLATLTGILVVIGFAIGGSSTALLFLGIALV